MTTIFICPCNTKKTYQQCCGRYHNGAAPSTPQTLMRARYSAYALHNLKFITTTSLPAQQAQLDTDAIAQWSQNSLWLGLEIISETINPDQRHATVDFIAHWQDALDQQHYQHHEKSLFIKSDTHWYFYDPNVPLHTERNAPCPCGSKLKFKKCCAPYL